MRDLETGIGSRYALVDRSPARRSGSVSRRTIAITGYLLFPLLIAAACFYDRTVVMVPPAKGLTQHFGFWAIFATTPLIVFITSRLLYQFAAIICDIDSYCLPLSSDVRHGVETLVRRHVQSLGLRSRRSIAIFIMLMIGLVWWCIVNIFNTVNPASTYHHDVFDAYQHRAGFIVTKLYVFLVFAVVYAIAIFVAVHVTASMVSIMKYLRLKDILRVDLFHEDNCGGLSRFGNINLLILAIYTNFFFVIVAMYKTHETTYPVMLFSLVGSSLLAFIQSVFAVYNIHIAIARRKDQCLQSVVRRLNDIVPISMPHRGRFPTDLLTLRNHVVGVNSFPYAKGAATAVNVIRFAPAAMAVFGLFTR